jgi:hypothetical protein
VKRVLNVGTAGKRPFTLPFDFVTRTLAIVAIRGAGKTIAATVLAEEMAEAGLPWIAFDPVGVWWGLRVNPDGSPGGYPVLIVGGEHADLQLRKDMGSQLADAVVQENVCCIVDLSHESKNTWRAFVAEFCDRLMELHPRTPRHVFLEEAPEFVPQKPMGEQKRSLAAVDRLIRLGRNRGYGATLISQRFATIQKDVVTQCESILAMRSIGKPDRTAVREWIAECVVPEPDDPVVEEFLGSLVNLPDGEGWFWSPQWLKTFERINVRARKTYHPGQTRSVGAVAQQVALSDVHDFVERFRTVLEAEPATPKPSGLKTTPAARSKMENAAAPALEASRRLPEVEAEATRLRGQVAELHRQLGAAKATIQTLRLALEPQYKALQRLFQEIETQTDGAGGGIDPTVWEPWMKKLGRGAPKMLQVLIDRGGRLTRAQLATLCSFAPKSGYFKDSLSLLNTRGLIEKDGEYIVLKQP